MLAPLGAVNVQCNMPSGNAFAAVVISGAATV